MQTAIRTIFTFLIFLLMISCAGQNPDPVMSQVDFPADSITAGSTPILSGGHLRAIQSISFDPVRQVFEFLPERTISTHWDLIYFWKYYPNMIQATVLEHYPAEKKVIVDLRFKNPTWIGLRDVRMMFPENASLQTETYDGLTVRTGASWLDPDPYVAFGTDFPYREFEPFAEDTRTLIFTYDLSNGSPLMTVILDAVVDDNTSEPYAFGEPQLTGRFFHIQISDWQDDITTAQLNMVGTGWAHSLRLAEFGEKNEWGCSVPDIDDGSYSLLLTAESPELNGENGAGQPSPAFKWIDLEWPPDTDIVPLPRGQGIYGFRFIDPDTNLPPYQPAEMLEKFKNEMGGDWLIVEYGEICNSGYLSMHPWIPGYINAMKFYAPEIPVHLNFDNLGFVSLSNDPCQHPPEPYTEAFFNNLLDSVQQQILDNPQFDSVRGLHFDIEIFPHEYTNGELFKIYKRYADFFGRLHMEENLRGRNISAYEFLNHPHQNVGDLAYLCTADMIFPECYFDKFTYTWLPGESAPFMFLEKLLLQYYDWAAEYGRPYYPILATWSIWIDNNFDTLANITDCPQTWDRIIDETCFGKGPLNTINEFDIVRAHDIHGMYVERVITHLDTGEQIFPSNGSIVYRMGDMQPTTVGDDFIVCRTAYALSRASLMVEDSENTLTPGQVTFRFENNQYWKAAGIQNGIERGAIGAISGQVRFSDGLRLPQHPDLIDNIRIELVEPLTPEIIDNPIYRKSMDIIAMDDGSYIFPDLPAEFISVRAVANGWESSVVEVDLNGFFPYVEGVDLLIRPE